MTHPRYHGVRLDGGLGGRPGSGAAVLQSSHYALIDDEVALVGSPEASAGVVDAVYREAVELSTGEQVLVAELVLIRRDAR